MVKRNAEVEEEVTKKAKKGETSFEAAAAAKAKLAEMQKRKKPADDSDDDSSSAPPPKAKAKAAPAKKPVVDSDDSSDDEPAPKAKAKPKAAAKKAADSDDSSSDEAPKAKAKPKAAAKKAADSDDSSSDEAPKAKAKPAKKAADSDDEEEAPATMKKKIDADGSGSKAGEEMTVFVGGIPWSVTEDAFRKDFSECGEIEKLNLPYNEEGKPKGIAFVTYKDSKGVEAALKYDGTDYGGRTLKVNLAGQKPEGKGKDGKGKGKGKDGGKGGADRNDELTVFVRGLSYETTFEGLKKDFEECGETDRVSLPKGEDGGIKGIAFIQFKDAAGVEKALKFDGDEYGGRTIYVSKANDGGGGKGKDGKDKGKGKGKDKDKGKKGKGKKNKDGLSQENRAAQHGGIVEFAGKKQSFDDSDDE